MNIRLKKFPILHIAVTAALILGASIYYSCSFAESDRPSRGAVEFGAKKQPEVNIPPALQGFSTVFADIAEKVVPTVVQVIPTKIDTVIFSNNPFYQFFGDQFGMEDFFGMPRNRRDAPPVQKKEYRQQSLGSGVIVSKDGYILTNYHVVKGADEIEIKTSDKRSFQATIVGSDSLTDVAVVKIKEKVNDLPVAFIGNSDELRPGDWSLAIGNPFSLSSSVTLGIISALGRTTGNDANAYQNFIQTDAAINPGNSGGALVNIRGELIGINTMIYTQSGGYMGIGFAIPINMAQKIMEDLIFEGKVSRGWLGVMIQELDQPTREAFGLDNNTQGVLIGDVFPDQPAAKAGILRGDIVTSVDGKMVTNPNELRNAIAAIHPGKKVPIELLRSTKKTTVYVTLSGRDKSQVAEKDPKKSDSGESGSEDVSKKLGIRVSPLTYEIKSNLGIKSNINGVIITGFEEKSTSEQEGLQENDIIIEINRKSVGSIKEFKSAVNNLKTGDSILLLIQRGENTFFKAFKIK
ncbi:MAG TPA: DegQ family serine endoprotease [Chitinispirillaceae bacterium]|nr:DegQ family serine endoprotease [Chitinispirillaceae bacterium]